MSTRPARRRADPPAQEETEPAPDPAASIGHNQPPEPLKPLTPEQVLAWLGYDCATLMARGAEIQGGIDRFLSTYETIPNEDVQGRAADFAGGRGGAIASFLTMVESRRKAEKQPFIDAERAVDGFFRRLSDSITSGRDSIRVRMNAYSDRLAAERRAAAEAEAAAAAEKAAEAERQALKSMDAAKLQAAAQLAEQAEHAEAKVSAPRPDMTRVTGVHGATVSQHTTWKFVEDESNLMELVKAVAEGKAPIAYLQFNTARIGIAVRSEKVREIPGCTIKAHTDTY